METAKEELQSSNEELTTLNEELRQRTAEDITFADDIETGRQLAQSLLNGTTRYTGDKRYVHKNSEVLWVSRTASIIRNEQGEPKHFLLMVEDVSVRKASEKALREAKEEADPRRGRIGFFVKLSALARITKS